MLGLRLLRPRILEGRVLLCRWLQPPQHEAHGAYQNHALAGIRPPLVILAVPPTTPHPSEGPLHHPPYWEWFKCRRPRRRAANHHMPSPAAGRRQPLVIPMVAVLGVPED